MSVTDGVAAVSGACGALALASWGAVGVGETQRCRRAWCVHSVGVGICMGYVPYAAVAVVVAVAVIVAVAICVEV